VIDTVQGFGAKTASDYLTGRGYARHLAVMDVRVSKILAALLGGDPARYTTEEFYREWEDFLVSHGLESATVDRVLYQNYHSIMADLAGKGGR
jgi:thermostable 8-oxoguanine DNA glycosylase